MKHSFVSGLYTFQCSCSVKLLGTEREVRTTYG